MSPYYARLNTTTGGTTITVSTASGFINAINGQGANSIQNINFAGHANQTTQGIGDDRKAEERVTLDANGNPIVTGPSLDGNWVSIGALLNGKMSPKGTINYDGCKAGSRSKTAKDPTGDNLPLETSKAVPNIPVSGSSIWTFGPSTSRNNFQVPFTVNTYINGVLQ